MPDLDFKSLADHLLQDIRNTLPRWYPNGKAIGQEFCVGSVHGENGKSLKINLNTGRWADFGTGQAGGDLISLYAAMVGINNGEAYKQLAGDMPAQIVRTATATAPAAPAPALCAPPIAVLEPSMNHFKHGAPSAFWLYRNPQGDLLFYVARYDTPEGKQIVPWSWNGTAWVAKGWPAPRPLYNLDGLHNAPSTSVLIVEGEKAAEAAKLIVGDRYIVITWPNGSQATGKAEWTPVYGRKILIWPDKDLAGIKAATAIDYLLSPHCKSIKVIIPTDVPEHFDAADALAAGWDWPMFKDWATKCTAVAPTPTPQPLPPPPSAPPPAPDIAIITEPEDPQGSAFALWDNLGLALNGQGSPHCNAKNIFSIIDQKYPGMVWYDKFYQRYLTRLESPDNPREWSDIDTLNFMMTIQNEYGIHKITGHTVNEAIRIYANKHTTNEPLDWLKTITWDGQPRIADFLTACFDVEPSDYTLTASRNFWIGIAARMHNPGCQLDNMIILEGAQGIGKSRALRLIGGKWYAELSPSSIDTKEVGEILSGKIIIEISELNAFSRAEVGTIKKLVSSPSDRFRNAYAPSATDHPRTCVFIGTTNEQEYLRDNTGARRFWPIKCGTSKGAIAYDFIARHREQFYAEASHAYHAGATWYDMPATTADHQDDRRQSDEWEHIINGYLSAPSTLFLDQITIQQIGSECLNIIPRDFDRATQMRIAGILRYLRWEKRTSYVVGHGAAKIWHRPTKPI